MKIHFLLLLASWMLLFSTIGLAESDGRTKRRQATEQELSNLQQRIKQLQQNQSKNRSSLTKEQTALKNLDLQIGKSKKSLVSTRQLLKKSQSKLKVLKINRKRLNLDKTKQQDALKAQIRAAYAGGKQEYFKLLFNQEDPSKLGRTLVYYDYLNQARVKKIDALNMTLEQLIQVEEKITLETKQLKALEVTLNKETNRLASLKKQRQQSIKQLSASLNKNTKQLKEWQENEQDLISLIEVLKQTVAELIPEESLDGLSKLKGKLNWPVKGQIRERFGTTRGNGQMRWSGVLISAKEGRDVSAIYNGIIVYSDYLRGFGLITIIDHGDGYMSLYGHNEALFKQPGDWVEAGEKIATVGQSGGYPSTGLYFEIRHRSKALNPKRYIRR